MFRWVLLVKIALISLQSCASKEYLTERPFGYPDFPITKDLSGLSYPSDKLEHADKLLVVGDHLVVSNRFGKELLYVFDKYSLDFLYAKGFIGEGPNEIRDAWTIFKGSNNSIWVFSGIGKTLSKFSLEDSSTAPQIHLRLPSEFNLEMSIVKSSDSTVITRSAVESSVFSEFNLSGKKINNFGQWIHLTELKASDYVLSDLHQGKLVGDSELGRFVIACIFRNQIEVLNRNTNEIILINGPDQELPKFEIIGIGNSERLVLDESTPFAYIDICFDGNIYGLYSGLSFRESLKLDFGAKDIFVFDTLGSPIIRYILNKHVRSIAIDRQERKIFSIIHNDAPSFVVFQF